MPTGTRRGTALPAYEMGFSNVQFLGGERVTEPSAVRIGVNRGWRVGGACRREQRVAD